MKKNKRSFSWINPSLEVKKLLTCGNGVFSTKKIKKETLLAVFGGYVMTPKEESSLPDPINDYSHQIHENFVLGIMKENDIQKVDFFNHSCDPNAGFRGQIFLVAMRDIKKGEQITFDYAMVLSKSKGVKSYKMKCLCSSEICRGTIDEEGWKNPILQKRYQGYFQWYLEDKIKKIRNDKKI